MGSSRSHVRLVGRLFVASVACASVHAVAAPPRTFEQCRAAVLGDPQSLDGYRCLFSRARVDRQRVLEFLEAQLQQRPTDPRPRLYRALVQHLSGQEVADEEWSLATEGFAREGDLTGEVYALTSHVGYRCFGKWVCDEQVRVKLWRADLLARRSGDLELQQLVEIWRLKLALTIDDLAAGEASEARLRSLGDPTALWLRAESLMARAHLASLLWDYPRERRLYAELVELLDPSDSRRALAMGGVAAGAVHQALQGLESPARAEVLVREAITAEQKAQVDIYWPENGYLSNQVHLALLLGPTPEAIDLLRSSLAGQRARRGWTHTLLPLLSLTELLSTQPEPDLDAALAIADEAVEHAFRYGRSWEKARTLLLRSRVHFRRGDVSSGASEGLAALELLEGLRERQGNLSMRMRYAEPLSVAYHAVAGAMLEHRGALGGTTADDAFQVMERLRARGLLERYLADGGQVPPVPTVAKVQGALAPHEALVSFQIWRAEPSVESPFRQGSSWATLITAHDVSVVRVPDADLLEPQIRAFVGLLEARDGAGRMAGAKVGSALLGPVLSQLPADVESLVLVPDGVLHRLPFDALSSGPRAPYLAERFRVSVAPSAALWLQLRAATPLRPGAALVLADPAGDRLPGEAVAQERAPATLGFGALRHSRGEARAAMAAFPRANELRTGVAASEAYLKSARSQAFFAPPPRHPRRGRPRRPRAVGGGALRGGWRGWAARARGDLAAAAPGPDRGPGRLRDLDRHRPPRRRGDEPGPGVLQRRRSVGGGDAEPGPGRRDGGLLHRALPGPGAGGLDWRGGGRRQAATHRAGRSPGCLGGRGAPGRRPDPSRGGIPGPSGVVACERSGHRLRRGGGQPLAPPTSVRETRPLRRSLDDGETWRRFSRCRLRGPGGRKRRHVSSQPARAVPGDPRWLNSGRPGLKGWVCP